MTRASIIAAVTLLLGGLAAARADSLVTARGLTYSDIRIRDVKGCRLIFATLAGRGTPRPAYGLKEIQVREYDSFNKAEKLAAKDNWVEALKLYDRALSNRMMKGWMRQLVAIRRLRALNAAGRTDAAVEQWFEVVKADGASPGSLAISPSRFAPAGSKANSRAVAALKNRRKQRGVSKAYADAISQLLTRLYRHEARGAKAAPATARPPGSGAGGAKAPSRPHDRLQNLPGRLAAIQTMLMEGKAKRALGLIEAALRRYKTGELPAALLLRGKAQVMLARGEKAPRKKQELLLRAGLNFMRAAQFSLSNEAPEALFEAARLHTMLARPNRAAAIAAYQAIISRYPDSPVAPRARKALDALRSDSR